jgi:hypothetical protein
MAEVPQAECVFDRFGCVALIFYAAISVFVFARSLLPDFADSYVGQGPDPSQFMWSLVWWPHAIAHRSNPLFTHAIFAPAGLNLAWRNTIPLASLFVSPITAAFGPVVAYNILSLASPALAAWTAFILCRHIAHSYWPAILGGYLFGFSAYMLGHTFAGHLNLVLVFPVPLAVYLAVRRISGTFKPFAFAALMGLTLAAQFLLSTEIFATMTVFGVMAIALALGFNEGEDRRRIAWLLASLASAYALTLLLVSPYLYFMFSYALPRGQIWSASLFSADALNFLIPTEVNLLGHLPVANSISAGFPGKRVRTRRICGPGSSGGDCRLRVAALARTVRQAFDRLVNYHLCYLAWTVTAYLRVFDMFPAGQAVLGAPRPRQGFASAVHDVRVSPRRDHHFAMACSESGGSPGQKHRRGLDRDVFTPESGRSVLDHQS